MKVSFWALSGDEQVNQVLVEDFDANWIKQDDSSKASYQAKLLIKPTLIKLKEGQIPKIITYELKKIPFEYKLTKCIHVKKGRC